MISVWKFRNGCRAVYEKMQCSQRSTCFVCCNIGSAHETRANTGFSHLLEHLLLVSGTETNNVRNIFQLFDVTGTEFNAYTTKTQTVFSFNCLTEHLKEFLVIFGYLMFTSKVGMGTRSIEKEQQVIKQENLSDENQSNFAVYDIFESQVYKNTPFMTPVDGDSLKKKKQLNMKALQKFYATYYVPGNISLSIVSGLPPEEVHVFLKESLFFKRTYFPVVKHPVFLPGTGTNPGYSIVSQNTETSSLMIGFSIPAYTVKESFCFEFLKFYLNRMDGVLFNYFRMQRGSAYRFNAEVDEEEVGGYFSINVETTPGHVLDILRFCVGKFRSLVMEGITLDVFETVKKHINESLRMKSQDATELGEFNMKNISEKKTVVPLSTIFEKYYKTMEISEIHQAMLKYFTSSQMVVSIVGKNAPIHSEVEKICAGLA